MRRGSPARHSSSLPAALDGDASRDALFGGALPLWQPTRGYRVNVDSLLLGAFAADGCRGPLPRLVDLGAGVGALTLIVHHLRGVRQADLVEQDPRSADIARHNLSESQIQGTVHCADLLKGLPRGLSGVARLVVCNPPFFPTERARPSLERDRRAARSGEVGPFLRAASRALGRRARACFVYPAPALVQFFDAARREHLVPKRLRLVHPFAGEPARIALVELARAKPGGLVIEPALVEWTALKIRSPEVERLLSGQRSDRE